ncbi:MAG: glycosyltransferase family 39 protein [Pontiellaceae bacterium]|nr:glycosyltransferase family 39 protein [Pontiellaceae bacterium]
MKRNHFIRPNKYELLALLLIFTAVVMSRFLMLGHASFGTDSMEFYKTARVGRSVLELWRNPPWLNQIPLNEIVSLLMVKLGLPATPFVVRLPFAVMGVLSVCFIWQFARRWFGAGAALLALLLACLNPYAVYHARQAYYYAGSICFSAALFSLFWLIKEQLRKKEQPGYRLWAGWLVIAALTCHMHMGTWPVVALQALLIFIFGLIAFAKEREDRLKFLTAFFAGNLLLGAVMSRWIYRAVQMVIINTVGGGHHTGDDARAEFLRLFPAYFAGQNICAIVLLFICVALALFALSGSTEAARRYRSLTWICALHIAVLLLYVGVVGAGVAKITYFSAIWPHFIWVLGIGSFLGIQALFSGRRRTGSYALLIGSYIALTGWPVYAIVRLEGSPTPHYKINDWILKNLPDGTPVLTDRWLEAWNELAVHNSGKIAYTFTVPDEPLETFKRLKWRETAEQFFEKYPDAAFLELERGKYEAEVGKWAFLQTYFARRASVTNDAAMILRRTKVFPLSGFSVANTNRIITHIYYNTTEDLLAAFRKEGRDVLRLYGKGWSFIKPSWPKGDYTDYRVFGETASIDLYNLKETSINGLIQIYAAVWSHPKPVTVNGSTVTFSSKQIGRWDVPIVLKPGRNMVPFTSPTNEPLFVLDIRWKPAAP